VAVEGFPTPILYFSSTRYKRRRVNPSVSAARDLFPPTLQRIHYMLARNGLKRLDGFSVCFRRSNLRPSDVFRQHMRRSHWTVGKDLCAFEDIGQLTNGLTHVLWALEKGYAASANWAGDWYPRAECLRMRL
jgi:hypothetical protein